MSPKTGSFRSALQHRDFRWLLTGMTISQVGDWLYNVALIVFVYGATKSATWVAITTVLRLAPYVIFGPLGGEIADRYERRVVMIWSDVIRLGLMLGLAVIAQTNGPVLLAGILAFATTAAGTPYNPAVAAITPQVVGESDLAAANSINSAVQMTSIIAGPAIGALLLALGSPATAFYLNAVTFGLSGLAVLMMRTRSVPPPPEEGESAIQRIRDGMSAIAASRPARALVIFIVVTSFIYGTDTVLLVLASKERLGTGADGYGYLLAALGAGGLIASFTTNRLAASRTLGPILVWGLIAYTAPTVLMIVVREPMLAVAIQIVRGAGTIVVDVLVITALQRWAPADVVGRVFGIVYALAVGGMVVGAFIAPPIVALAGLGGALLVFGAVPGAIALASLPRLHALDREALQRTEELRPAIELLSRLGLFAQAPRQTLEALAGASLNDFAAKGTKIVRQGDPADAFYAIASGKVEVRKRGQVLATLGPDDYFGEIGLLQQVPRTADVVATADTQLLRVSGEDFVDAVHHSPGAEPLAMEAIARRLARRPRRTRAARA